MCFRALFHSTNAANPASRAAPTRKPPSWSFISLLWKVGTGKTLGWERVGGGERKVSSCPVRPNFSYPSLSPRSLQESRVRSCHPEVVRGQPLLPKLSGVIFPGRAYQKNQGLADQGGFLPSCPSLDSRPLTREMSKGLETS